MPETTSNVKRITLTSKKNWWMVELDDGDDQDQKLNMSANSFSSSETAVSVEEPQRPRAFSLPQRSSFGGKGKGPAPCEFQIPRHPSSIFSFPVPTSYSAPSKPTRNLNPVAHGSASELFKCIVKKPEVVQLEINGEMQSNASDVTTQFLAELRVYTTVARHRNIAAFLGCLPGVGMVLEYIDGPTLYDVLRARSTPLPRTRRIDYHDQLLAALVHLHAFGLSHGDLSLLNIHIQTGPYDPEVAPLGEDADVGGTIKLLDFGRSVAATSVLAAPDAEPADPFAEVHQRLHAHGRFAGAPPTPAAAATPSKPKGPEEASRKVEQIHPGTRPFSAPEILRGECADAPLADAYSFGVILVCLDRGESVDIKPWDQRKDLLPKGFLDRCDVFGARAAEYLRRWNERRRLVPEDRMGEE